MYFVRTSTVAIAYVTRLRRVLLKICDGRDQVNGHRIIRRSRAIDTPLGKGGW